MMSGDMIARLSREAARRSRAEGTEPWEAFKPAIDAGKKGDWTKIKIPNIGDRVPRGWELVDVVEEFGEDRYGRGLSAGTFRGKHTYFVDKSGFGGASEPALTMQELVDRMRPGYAYGMVEEGQFQAVVAVFRRKREKRARVPPEHPKVNGAEVVS